MIERIDEASAQAVANTLWAYRAVRMTPPKELSASWASEKLGIVSIDPECFSDD